MVQHKRTTKEAKTAKQLKTVKNSSKQSELNDNPMQDFYFKPKRNKINWRLLSTINVDEIVRKVIKINQNNVDALHELIESVTYCDINDSELEDLDPNVSKLFEISQLIIEFLLHSQSFLLKHKQSQKEEIDELSTQNKKLMKHKLQIV